MSKSKAAIAGHPLHPIFVTIPIGLWCFVPVCDLIYHFGLGDDSWKKAALYCLVGGLFGAIPAIITGYIDWGTVKDPQAAKVAQFHVIMNIIASLLIGVSAIWRFNEVAPNYGWGPVIVSFVAVFITGISGYLGGELVSRYGISVHAREQGPPRE